MSSATWAHRARSSDTRTVRCRSPATDVGGTARSRRQMDFRDHSKLSRPSDQTMAIPTHALEQANGLFLIGALDQNFEETGTYRPQRTH